MVRHRYAQRCAWGQADRGWWRWVSHVLHREQAASVACYAWTGAGGSTLSLRFRGLQNDDPMTGMPPIAVLAGGLATRMRPLTEQLPKALLEVAGEPFIAHQLRLFAREGIRDVKLLVGYCWEQIEFFVGNGSRFGVKVDYIVDGPTLLGTGGAVRRAIDRLGPEFLVTYCDSWLDAPYAPVVEAFHESGRPALMCVFRNE